MGGKRGKKVGFVREGGVRKIRPAGGFFSPLVRGVRLGAGKKHRKGDRRRARRLIVGFSEWGEIRSGRWRKRGEVYEERGHETKEKEIEGRTKQRG